MSSDQQLDEVFNNSRPDEGTNHHLGAHFHTVTLMSLYLGKRYFGVNAAIITTIIAGIVRVTTAAAALTQTATIAETIYKEVSKSAAGLQEKGVLNKHLY